MIDTIKLRFHGLNDVKSDIEAELLKENCGVDNFAVPEHNELYMKLLAFKDKSFSVVKHYNREVNSEETLARSEFIHLETSQNKTSQHYLNMNMMRFENAKSVKEVFKTINGNYRIPSSYNGVSFFVNPSGSYCDFEFSIPKYLYGHNIAQFVPQAGSETKFHHDDLVSWKGQVSKLHSRLMKFIEKFLTDLCIYFELDTIPSLDYIEIRRIDLCYNQYFKSKEEALKILHHQMKLNHTKQTKRSKVNREFRTSFEHKKSDGAYFKIYHKGTEYSESEYGDRKKHLEENKRFMDRYFTSVYGGLIEVYANQYKKNRDLINGVFAASAKGEDININPEKLKEIKEFLNFIYPKLPYQVGFLKKEADKILRYEVSLNSSFFRYQYKNFCFRRKCEYHKKAKEVYKYVKGAFDNRNTGNIKISKSENDTYKMFNKWLNRAVFMTFTKNQILKRFNENGRPDYDVIKDRYRITKYGYRHTILANKDIACFDDYFLKRCCSYFRKLVDNFQVNEIPKYDDVQSRIKAYNEKAIENIEIYNEENVLDLIDVWGNVKCRSNGLPYTKPIQLLTQTQRRKYERKGKPFHLMGVDETKLMFIVDLMINKKQSQRQIANEMGMTPRKFQRYRELLKLFGIYENTLEMSEAVEMKTDFSEYYWLTSGDAYASKFFTHKKHINYA